MKYIYSTEKAFKIKHSDNSVMCIGEMVNFNLQCFLDAANELVRADEPIRALHLLDNLPGFYRDYMPRDVLILKNEILKYLATPSGYAYEEQGRVAPVDSNITGPNEYSTLRAKLIDAEVGFINKQGHAPIIIDLGPGEYWLPIVLKNRGHKFTYNTINVNPALDQKAKAILGEEYIAKEVNHTQPILFIACEIIEHLHNENDIKTEMLRTVAFADVIHVSTPLYTFDSECTDWTKKRMLEHLRTYTPKEFFGTLDKMFPEYLKTNLTHQVMHSRLALTQTKFGYLKNIDNFMDKGWEIEP